MLKKKMHGARWLYLTTTHGGYIILKKKMHGARWLYPATTHGGYIILKKKMHGGESEASNILSLRKRGGSDVKNCCVLHTQFYK